VPRLPPAHPQANVRKVWTRFRWLSHKWIEAEMRNKSREAAEWQQPRSAELEAIVARAGSRVGAALLLHCTCAAAAAGARHHGRKAAFEAS
jgi:hypothetical protein